MNPPILARGRELAASALTEPGAAGSNPQTISATGRAESLVMRLAIARAFGSGRCMGRCQSMFLVKLMLTLNPSGSVLLYVRGTWLKVRPESLTMECGMVQNFIYLTTFQQVRSIC